MGRSWRGLAQAYDLSVFVQVDAGGVRRRRQAGHGAHLAADRVDKTRADRCPHLAYRQHPPRRGPLQLGLRRDGEVCLGDANGQPAESARLVGVELLGGGGVVLDATRAVNAERDRLDLLAQRRRVRVQELERARHFGCGGYLLRHPDRSAPMSAPKPASVTRYSPPWMPIKSARTDDAPLAMLPNGPAWTSTGVFSSVCSRFGLIASRMITAIAPPACRKSAVMGLPSRA